MGRVPHFKSRRNFPRPRRGRGYNYYSCVNQLRMDVWDLEFLREIALTHKWEAMVDNLEFEIEITHNSISFAEELRKEVLERERHQ